jgi:hypothetical protein
MVRVVSVVGLESNTLVRSGAYGEVYEAPDADEIKARRREMAEERRHLRHLENMIDRLERRRVQKLVKKAEVKLKKKSN